MFLGDRRDVSDLLRASDVFVFPSLYEGLGGAVLEAMATGLPVVASRVPAVEEVLGDTGYLVEPDEPSELAQVLQGVLDIPDRAAAGRRGLERFLSYYEIERVHVQMGEMFRLVSGLRARTPPRRSLRP
jgi:glycosyltransferase involved in cell wall biosynthesis